MKQELSATEAAAPTSGNICLARALARLETAWWHSHSPPNLSTAVAPHLLGPCVVEEELAHDHVGVWQAEQRRGVPAHAVQWGFAQGVSWVSSKAMWGFVAWPAAVTDQEQILVSSLGVYCFVPNMPPRT